MNKFWAMLALGVLVVLLPFTGFPPEWRKITLVALGLAILVLTTLLMRQTRRYQLADPEDHQEAE